MIIPPKLRSAGERIATAFMFENEEAVIEFTRSYMVERVRPYNEGHLVYAIQNRTDVWANSPEKLRAYAKRVAMNPRVAAVYQKYSAQINADLVLDWLKADRPAWYGVIVNWGGPEAMDWLRSEVEKVKTELRLGEQRQTTEVALAREIPRQANPPEKTATEGLAQQES